MSWSWDRFFYPRISQEMQSTELTIRKQSELERFFKFFFGGIRKSFKEGFVRSVALLAGGTAVAQLFAIIAMPILTRFYSPKDFGVVALFLALLGFISVVSGFRYEIAIPIPDADRTAANLIGLALLATAVTCIVTCCITQAFKEEISAMMQEASLAKLLWLLPIAVLGRSSYSIFQSWAIRKKDYKRIARTKMAQSFWGILVQLLLGWKGLGAIGLIIGQIVMGSAGALSLGGKAVFGNNSVLNHIRVQEMKAIAKEYERFPKYSVLEALANVAAIQLPIILIGIIVSSTEAGFLSLGIRIMQAPLSLIGLSISQVYYTHAVEEHRKNNLADYTTALIVRLGKLGVGPILFIGIVAPFTFQSIFGQSWQRSGELVAWMTPWFIFQFMASPISMALHVTSNQKIALLLQIFNLLFRALIAIEFVNLSYGADYISESFAISSFIFYLIYFIVICYVSSISFNKILFAYKRIALYISAWGVSGIIIDILWYVLAKQSNMHWWKSIYS